MLLRRETEQCYQERWGGEKSKQVKNAIVQVLVVPGYRTAGQLR